VVEPPHLKNISQNRNLPQRGMKISKKMKPAASLDGNGWKSPVPSTLNWQALGYQDITFPDFKDSFWPWKILGTHDDPKMNECPLKMDHFKKKSVLRSYISFRGSTSLSLLIFTASNLVQ